MAPKWATKPIKNLLLDINGVLYESGEEHAIKGSVEALNELIAHGFQFCLVTNECSTAQRKLVAKLNSFGYDCIDQSKIVSPAPVASQYLLEHNLRPRLHMCDGLMEDFEANMSRQADCDKPPNCLVLGDAVDKISRDYIDESLELMLKSPEPPQIITLGAGRYYKDGGRYRMDTGAYAAAFEFCLGTKALNVGKPSAEFFHEAMARVNGSLEDTVMIGDDVVSDVGGAQKLGMRGFLVRTGKYKQSDETSYSPDHVFENFREAVDEIIASQSS